MNTPDTAPDKTAPIAIIGMACLFPQAPDLHAFWQNILLGVDAIGEPVAGWDAERYLRSGRIKTPHGGYLKDLYRFNPTEFGIMPNSLDGGEPDQYLALRIARDALRDAGYLRDDADHRDTGIILGHSTYLHRGQGTIVQHLVVIDQTIEMLKLACPALGDDEVAKIQALMRSKLPQSNADVAPGLVPNVMTGRIANRLNLHGPNYLVDAACSSSLLAVGAAIDELRAGRSRMMLAGGVNASLPAEVSYIFTQLGALSGRGKVRPFEAGSDGTLLGEGLGVVVLKRLDEALADGDRIYAVLRGIGQASDGRGHGLLAPSVDGETLAIRRAYDAAGVDPATVGLIECHGTGIPLGDKTEIAAIRNVLGDRLGEQGTVAIGSVKSMISHCIPAAGIAGLIKSALALHHRVLPPTLCGEPNPELGIAQTPLYINTQAAPWIHAPGTPRRAGVNSFGFGGINAHGILEQAPAQAARPAQSTPWPAELCVLAADSAGALVDQLQQLSAGLATAGWRLAEVAQALARQALTGNHRLAIVAKNEAALATACKQAAERLAKDDSPGWATRGGIVYSRTQLPGKLAFLFPGEGSQYLGMLADLAMCFDEVREWLDFWRGLYDDAPGATRTDIVYPPAIELSAPRRKLLEARLHDMDVGSEAVFVGGQALNSLLQALGVVPDVMVGHSSGESAALAASGVIIAPQREQLAEFIRQLNVVYQQVLAEGKIPTGALLAVGALPAANVLARVKEARNDIVVAMDNCANQLVLYGSVPAIEAMQKTLAADGAICLPLPFDRGYHTPDFQSVSDAFLAYYRSIKIGKPQVPLYSCSSAGLFPDAAAGIHQLAAAQWSNTVRFRETILRMHDEGVRVFLEVGPSNNLSAFVGDILVDRDHLSLASNMRRRNGVEQVLSVLGQLFVNVKPVALQQLFARRALNDIDLTRHQPAPQKGLLLDNTMPQMRLGEADRETLRALLAPAVVQPLAGPALPQAAEAAPPVPTAPDMPAPEPAPAQASETVAAEDCRGEVMADYFDLMRGFLDQQRQLMQGWQAVATEPEQTTLVAEGVPAYPLLSQIVTQDEQQVVAEVWLSVDQQAFLRDHVLSGPVSVDDPNLTGLACVPLMVSLEMLAEAAAALIGRQPQLIEHVRAFDWIALDDGQAVLQVRAERTDQGGCHALLTRDGKPIVSADFRFEADWQLPAVAAPAAPQASHWNDAALYQTGMFHGPIFQSVMHLDGYDAGGISGQLSSVSLAGFFTPGERPHLVLNPVLLDAVGQLAAFWIAQYAGYDFNSFPSTIERIELREACPADRDGLRLLARQQALDPTATAVGAARRWDFDCVDASGRSLLRVGNLVNIFFAVPNRFYQVRRDPLVGALGAPAALSAPAGVLLWDLPMLGDDFCAQSGGIFLRILAHALLGAAEREEWHALQGSLAYRRQWLLGRACLKEAVREWLLQHCAVQLHPADIWVIHDSRGAPMIDGWWRDELPMPAVSLSHNAAACLAAVAMPGSRVGIDREDAGRVQRPELLQGALAAEEQQSLHAFSGAARTDRLLRIWCAKEAAAKLTGLGLQGEPQAYKVRFIDEGIDRVMVEFEGMGIEVQLIDQAGAIVALAVAQDVAVEVAE
ncbi:polyketide synthase [Aquabacterium sp.]|uniref:polyketide synthase n=1 Tax=Aquabacterium sp. TaxID=1872578 RepID=UPI002CD5C34D|nr:polyketide synthase [Aquabacterium sp.]HSW05872.1 beta-ketoacyl synthase N-terminal-like domain-containing protein [Aquabacterium sp.]